MLTGAGAHLLDYAERILQLTSQAVDEVSGYAEVAGALTVGAADSLLAHLLPPVIYRFRERYPNVDLHFRSGNCSDLQQELSRGTVEVALLLDVSATRSQFVLEPLAPIPLVMVAAHDHPLAHRLEVALADLQTETFLLTGQGCSYRVRLQTALAAAQVQPKATIELHNLEAIKRCVIMGAGVALLPRPAVSVEIEQRQVAALPLEAPMGSVTPHIAWHKDKWLSPAMRAFVAVTRTKLTTPTP